MQRYFEMITGENDFNEILKLKQKRDVETISFFMKRGSRSSTWRVALVEMHKIHKNNRKSYHIRLVVQLDLGTGPCTRFHQKCFQVPCTWEIKLSDKNHECFVSLVSKHEYKLLKKVLETQVCLIISLLLLHKTLEKGKSVYVSTKVGIQYFFTNNIVLQFHALDICRPISAADGNTQNANPKFHSEVISFVYATVCVCVCVCVRMYRGVFRGHTHSSNTQVKWGIYK